MHAAARLYHLEDATQAEVADRLGTSRATVSRLLSEARRLGIVRIEVLAPADVDDSDLSRQTALALGLRAVHLSSVASRTLVGAALAPALSSALTSAGLTAGDVLLVSSGRTVYEAAQAELPSLPGVLLAPTVGGQDELEAWYQTNEITRQTAVKVGGTPTFLYAPALPSPRLYATLMAEESTRRVLDLWERARCAVVGVGAAPLLRRSLPSFVPTDSPVLRHAVGDICTRVFDSDGREVPYPGSERLIATSFELLRRVPVAIAVAVGQGKVPGIVAGARAGYFNTLVTDPPTAAALVAAVHEASVSP
ncbi:MAG: helix-turn-helix domain-containing protein [Pseudonocardia sp.]|nr:helix-turn-helix domain-containing protein [Pseudonocardia sp.]